MTFGLACDRDGYDLSIPPCRQCGSRGCPKKDTCRNDEPAWRAKYLCEQADRLDREANEMKARANNYRHQALSIIQQLKQEG